MVLHLGHADGQPGGREHGWWCAWGWDSHRGCASIILAQEGENKEGDNPLRALMAMQHHPEGLSPGCRVCGLTAGRAPGPEPAGGCTGGRQVGQKAGHRAALTFFSEYWNISMASSTCPSS